MQHSRKKAKASVAEALLCLFHLLLGLKVVLTLATSVVEVIVSADHLDVSRFVGFIIAVVYMLEKRLKVLCAIQVVVHR